MNEFYEQWKKEKNERIKIYREMHKNRWGKCIIKIQSVSFNVYLQEKISTPYKFYFELISTY